MLLAKEQLKSALDDLEAALEASAKKHDGSHFLNGSKPNMIDLMLLPMLERVEALLLHPFLHSSGLHLSAWPHVSSMLLEGRRPGLCSFGELQSDAETLLAISLREDPGRTPVMALEQTILQPETSLSQAAQAAAGGTAAARREAAARVAANGKAVAAFACCGRGCGRTREAAWQAALGFKGAPEALDLALRWVVASLLREDDPIDLESRARRIAETIRQTEEAAASAAALQFLAQNIGVPRDMAAEPAAALRAQLRLLVAAIEQRGPKRGIGRPGRKSPSEASGKLESRKLSNLVWFQ